MKINLRILAIVTGFMVIAASAVVMARFVEQGSKSFLAERVPLKGAATAEDNAAGLLLQVNANGLSLALPGCNVKDYQDKFFLHVYPETENGKASEKYINMDFNLAQEKSREFKRNGATTCVFDKSFVDLKVKQISVGQFSTPGGRCCEVIWSRSFMFDGSFPKI